MARGQQLTSLVALLRDEIGQSSNVAAGTDGLGALKNKLRQAQEFYYLKHDWPFLRIKPTKTLSAGQRYYDLPTADGVINFERIEEVVCWYNLHPYPLERGIELSDYEIYDSSLDERQDPVAKWDIRWTGSAAQIEVWPMPSVNTMYLQFVGIRDLRAFLANDDVADLDDWLLVWHAAADILARRSKKDAGRIAAKAQDRFNTLKGRVQGATKPFSLGGSVSQPTHGINLTKGR